MARRLHVLAEGQTEETFAEEVLGDYLTGSARPAYTKVTARTLIKEAGLDGGGIVKWDRARRLIGQILQQDRKCIVTTMVDYYALPKSWIDRARYTDRPTAEKATAVRSRLASDIQADLPDSRLYSRFIPYVSMHEFEGLLFSDCDLLAQAVQHPKLASRFHAVRNSYRNGTPEDIDEGFDTAPARRILDILPEYEKSVHGVLAALEITVDTIRRECPEFNRWLEVLEQSARA